VLAVVAGAIVGTDGPLGIALIAAGLLLIGLERRGRHQPPRPSS
jgi:hypothetical protein